MEQRERRRPELLAPAGNLESFFAALEHGADAIYVGYRHHNARAAAPNFGLEEIARLTEYVHARGARLHVALNAVLRENELEDLVAALDGLARIRPDGLIVQDGGLARLCRRHFPDLLLHASTLMTVHNQTGVQQMEAMGFQRAVLARELSLEEIAAITAATTLELEIFIHGALCFSYSGLCLASSYFGGRSSLRGRCVQPCRRLYRAGRDQGYFLSPNDLSAIDLIPALRQLRIAAFKIEGRMKPASYVAAVVSAYRLVLDAGPGEEQAAIAKARRSLRQALGRKPTHGFLVGEERRDVITPQRVGASGQLAAAVERVHGDAMSLRLRVPLAAGDRLRLDSDEGFEKKAFRLRDMSLKGRPVTTAEAGALVRVPRISGARAGDRLFRTDIKMAGVSTSSAKLRRRLWQETATPPRLLPPPTLAERVLRLPPPAPDRSPRPLSLYLRLEDPRLLGAALQAGCQGVLLQATPETLRRLPPSPHQEPVWLTLPPVIHERELPMYREQVRRHQELGHNRWVVANWGHFPLFDRPPEMLLADLTFNVLNSQSAVLLHELGCQGMILSLENDRTNLQHLVRRVRGLNPLLTIYGRPPLFTSRLKIRPRPGELLQGADQETLEHESAAGVVLVRPSRPLCLFDYLRELRDFGIQRFVIDLRGFRLRGEKVRSLVEAYRRERCPDSFTTFNYLRRLV
ncbi:MAG TPA: peptidase U32 family protein [Syntrophobacteria bacterium]|nr:peptidase U32 family protein [Syntrophobacteria bacterium]